MRYGMELKGSLCLGCLCRTHGPCHEGEDYPSDKVGSMSDHNQHHPMSWNQVGHSVRFICTRNSSRLWIFLLENRSAPLLSPNLEGITFKSTQHFNAESIIVVPGFLAAFCSDLL